MKHMEGRDRFEKQLLCLDDFIKADDPVRLLDAFVDKLDLQALNFSHVAHKSEGRPPYHPSLLLKLYLYGYINRIRSSRRLEEECTRNVQLQWLLHGLTPNYHTIADFRKLHPSQLKSLFQLYVRFLAQAGLLGKKNIATDSTKLQAVNSKANNYNSEKIDRALAHIDAQKQQCLTQIHHNGQTQDPAQGIEIKTEHLQNLEQRKQKYVRLKQQLQQSGQEQISTTDADSRALVFSHGQIQIGYNVQAAADDQHNLLVHIEATNEIDRNALYASALQAKANLRMEKEQPLHVLADKGYHTAKQLLLCALAGLITYVAILRPAPGTDQQSRERSSYYKERFDYDEDKDCYVCPQGRELYSDGIWHERKKQKTTFRYKNYATPACSSCALRQVCTQRKRGRVIERGEYEQAAEQNKKRMESNPELYRRRKAIIEHPFGTIKRGWGYGHVLLKGLKKVDGEVNLIGLVYNLKRSMNILGYKGMLEALKNWTPDYKRALGAVKKLLIQSQESIKEGTDFLAPSIRLQKQAA